MAGLFSAVFGCSSVVVPVLRLCSAPPHSEIGGITADRTKLILAPHAPVEAVAVSNRTSVTPAAVTHVS